MSNNNNKISLVVGVFLLMNTMFGVGVLTIPAAFYSCGWLTATIFLVFIAHVTIISIYSLGLMAVEIEKEKENPITYFTICESVHESLAYIIDVCVVLSSILVLNIYTEFLNKWACNIIQENYNISTSTILILLLCAVSSVACIKDLSVFKVVSYISTTSFLYLLFLIVYYFYKLEKIQGDIPIFGNKLQDGMSSIIFSLACQVNVVPVVVSLEDKSEDDILKLSLFATVGGLTCYVIIGVLCFIQFKHFSCEEIISILNFCEETKPIITNVFGKKMFLSRIAVLAYGIVLSSAYCLQLIPGRVSCMNLISKIMGSPIGNNKEIGYRITITICYGVINFFVVFFKIKSLTLLCLNSALFTTSFSFIIPSIVYLIKEHKNSKPPSALSYIVGLNGIIGLGFMVYILYGLIYY